MRGTPIDVGYLRARLRYEPETGKLFWLTAPHEGAVWARWNGRWAGREAFTSTKDTGYRQGRLDGRTLRAHLVAWALHHGVWPDHDIDHDDGDKTNNRIGNLLASSPAGNARNMPLRADNTSGEVGVTFCKQTSAWRARISTDDMRDKHIGRFPTVEAAALARRQAGIEHGYHPNHGRN